MAGARRPPVLVELVGPPGAGKSTVFAALRAARPEIEPLPVLRRSGHVVELGAGVAAACGAIVRHRAFGAQWNRERLIMMGYLGALPRALSADDRDRLLVFDQGPLYFLTRPVLRDPRLAPWWDRRLAVWRALLDVVVVLDAPDAVLVDRINARAKAHRAKGQSAASARDVLTEHREAVAAVLAGLEGAPGCAPDVVQVDTSRQEPRAVAERVLAACDRRRVLRDAA